MKRGLDTNVLVYAHLPILEGHRRVRSFLRDQLSTPNTVLVLTALVLHEFVHVVTDPRRFDPPVTMAEALAIARPYLHRSNVEPAPLEEATVSLAFELLERHHLGRKRIADTLFAAALLQHGVRSLVTCNPDDFAVFEELEVIDPRYPV